MIGWKACEVIASGLEYARKELEFGDSGGYKTQVRCG